ncbi:MAG: peptide chain release factor 2 [Spirochaetes bacterium]|nr:peptide chain release factor 2 [Spirochaetota bacterium]
MKKKFFTYQEQFNEIKKDISKESLLNQINILEKETISDNFWKDKLKAKETIYKINNLKEKIKLIDNLVELENDILELINIVLEENQNDLIDLNIIVNKYKEDFENFIYSEVFEEIDSKNAILTIHPGAGGTESTDWANMLLKIYLKYFERKNFSYKIVDLLPGEGVGIKSVTVYVSGKNVYGLMRNEVGIHRLVRISPFDSNKRRHTSFCSVFCYPDVEDDINIELNPSDLKIETYRASGAGGQHVNKTDSAVRITHIPTGIVVSCQNDRSQHKNKEIALKILKSKLYMYYKDQTEKEIEKSLEEKKSIEWGNQIRSYILQPYVLIKDHRTEFESTNVDKIFDGEIDDFIFEMIKLKFKKKWNK